VVSVQLDLSYISQFLHSLTIGKTGKALIIDKNGYLIGSSDEENPLIIVGEETY